MVWVTVVLMSYVMSMVAMAWDFDGKSVLS
jgi:hypothetical protein